MIRRLSIGKKIVGLSVVLLSLMLAAAIYAFLQTRNARNAVNDVTGMLLPLSREVTQIETHILEQALMLERALQHPSEVSPASREIARFKQLTADIDSRLEKAHGLIQAGLAKARIVADAVQIARIEPELASLRREHQRYVEAGLVLASAARTDFARLQTVVSMQEERMEESIERLSGRLDSASQAESTELAAREERAYLISMENLALAVFAFLAGSIISAVLTRRMVRPVRNLISGAQQVARGNLDVHIETGSTDEIGTLAHAFQDMVGELRSKARIKETFGKYMDPRVVERLLADGQPSLGAGEKRVMTVFFSDLQGFSSISESLTAAGLVNLINNYLTLASEPIVGNEGVIDKYIGDAIMAFWGPPFYAAPDHARRACLAALAQYDRLAELKRMLPDILGFRKGIPEMHVRIGLSTGELIVGSIGSNVSKSFTVMGDTVNTASRLESVNKQFGTRILMDGLTFDLVRDSMEARELDHLGVAGKSDPVRVYELLGERGKVEAPRLRLRDAFEAGLAAYRQSDWDGADRHFLEAVKVDPHDKPAQLFRDRVRRFRDAPPPADWDGVWRLTEK